ncbi:ATP synthase subunit g, mitochondrial isoform X1 [Globicephala melas]|uniref:ATP synthase subunit g, mitochondrial isoform X1 n=1 Tax=Globicephala melas TaxID=9731 RepID=UPI00293D416F|nr:ATP synthase subunit g, mitochondrial isoform X1 [Globicephala melas]
MAPLGEHGRRQAEVHESTEMRPHQLVCFSVEYVKVCRIFKAAVTYSKPRLATFWHYAKVELVPPTPAEIPTAIQSLKKIINSAQTGSFKQLTVKEALLNGLVATEVWMWFYVGEIIGKRGIIGYNV